MARPQRPRLLPLEAGIRVLPALPWFPTPFWNHMFWTHRLTIVRGHCELEIAFRTYLPQVYDFLELGKVHPSSRRVYWLQEGQIRIETVTPAPPTLVDLSLEL